jgi:propionyl-CoA carboxylase alpha chain
MPGTVTAVHVAAGDAVAAGQPLLVLEAMKMQHPVVAPAAGIVRSLDVAVGRQVDAGAVLAVIEPTEEP